MTAAEFREELKRLGLVETGYHTGLIEVWLFDNLDFYLPRPEGITEKDRAEALDLVKKSLGIGVQHGPH